MPRPASRISTTNSCDQYYESSSRKPKLQVLSEAQIQLQAAKMDARLTEWASAAQAAPGLITSEREQAGGKWYWVRKPQQLKGLCAVDGAGKVIADAKITAANVAELFGPGPDYDAMAQRIGVAAPVAPTRAERVLTNAQLVGADALSTEQLIQLGHKCLKLNIRLRSTKYGIGGSRAVSAGVLVKLAGEEIEPREADADTEGAAAAGVSAQSGGDAEAMEEDFEQEDFEEEEQEEDDEEAEDEGAEEGGDGAAQRPKRRRASAPLQQRQQADADTRASGVSSPRSTRRRRGGR